MSDAIAHFQQDAPTCPNCGHVAVRNGACYKCLNCGESLGAPSRSLSLYQEPGRHSFRAFLSQLMSWMNLDFKLARDA